jgi:hypothetical protein
VAYELRCFPHDDADLAARATEHLGTLTRDGYSHEDGVPEDLQAALRALYPRVSVRRADRLAEFGPGAILYVYRDGRAR